MYRCFAAVTLQCKGNEKNLFKIKIHSWYIPFCPVAYSKKKRLWRASGVNAQIIIYRRIGKKTEAKKCQQVTLQAAPQPKG